MEIPEVVSALADCINDDDGSEGMLRYLAGLTGSAAVFEDSKLLALSARYPADEKNDTLSRCLSLKSCPAFRGAETMPLQTTDEYSGATVHRLAVAITGGKKLLGYLSLLSENEPLPEDSRAILKTASGFFAMQILFDRKITGIELKLTGNFVEDLVFSNNPDHDSIRNRAKALDYDIDRPHRLLIAEHGGGAQPAGRKRPGYDAELVKIAQTALNRRHGGMAVCKGGDLIILFRQETECEDASSAYRFAEEVINEAATVLRTKIFVGIGSVCTAPEDFKSSYVAAKKALEIGAFMITEGQVRSFEQFKAHALFLSTVKPQELQKYAKSQLDRLLEYDLSHNTEFLKTLQEFLYLRNNIEGTSKSLNMSVSGLKYRLKKIETILGLDLKDNKVCFDLQLALIILQLFSEYRI